jgi:hypothetical protein
LPFIISVESSNDFLADSIAKSVAVIIATERTMPVIKEANCQTFLVKNLILERYSDLVNKAEFSL